MTSAIENKSQSPLRSDEPILTSDQDRLARAHLVEIVGRHIVRSDTPHTIVVALNAPWGAGKSSFLNLLASELTNGRSLDKSRRIRMGDVVIAEPIVIRFNPWHYSSVEQLIRMFYAEFALGLETASKKDIAKKIGKVLENFGTLAGILHSGTGTALKEAGKAVGREQSLPELKKELDALLPSLHQRVIVFVDDIDRLERDALRLLFRMIRLNADFSNVTYVLAFDRLVVEKNLDESNGIRGRDYLEKIIQVSFDIPEPEAQTRHEILQAELNAVIGSIRTRDFDQHRFINVFHSGFKEHFRTIRHIKRYANGLRLTLPPVAEEVDLVDFLTIELFRVFHPEVYRKVASGKEMLAPDWGRREISVEQLRQWVNEVSALASPGFEEHVISLIRQLFPQLERVYRNTSSSGFDKEWRRAGRICSPSVFAKFFLLAIPRDEVSEVQMKTFVEGLHDIERTKSFLVEARAAGHARRFMERLEDFTEDLPSPVIVPLFRTLFDEGDSLRFESRHMFDITAKMVVPRVIRQCLMKIETEQERHDLLMSCVKAGTSLYTVVEEVALSEPTNRVRINAPTYTSHELWETLRDAAVKRINSASVDGTLWEIQELSYVLFRWRDWTDELTVRAAVEAYVARDENLIHLLGKLVKTAYSQHLEDKVGRKNFHMDKKDVETFLDLETVFTRLRENAEKEGNLAATATELLSYLDNPDRT